MVYPTRPWPKPHQTEAEFALYTAMIKMNNATKSIASKFLWKFGRGPEVLVKWPTGWAVLHDDGNGGMTSTESADPNDHYRPWLEANVGKQGWDWDWKIGSRFLYSDGDMADSVCIKFRKKHAHFASIVTLKWA